MIILINQDKLSSYRVTAFHEINRKNDTNFESKNFTS